MATLRAQRTLLTTLGAAILASLLAACGGQTAAVKPTVTTTNAWLAHIENSGTLRLAVMPDPPFMYEDAKTGQWEGPYIKLIQAWAQSVHVKIDVVPNTYTTVIASVQADDVDLAPGLSYTAARAEVVWYSIPSWEQIESIAVNTTTTPGVTTWDQINTATYSVCSIIGATEQAAYNADPTLYHFTFSWQDSITTCNLAVQSGRNNAEFDNWIANTALAAAEPSIRLIFGPSSIPRETSGSYVISKNYPQSDLNPLNAWITHSIADGQFAKWEREAGVLNPLNYVVPGGTVPGYVKTFADKMFATGSFAKG